MLKLKNIKRGIFLLLTACSHVYAALPTGAGEYVVNVPCISTRWLLDLTGLYIQPSTHQLDYAEEFSSKFENGLYHRDNTNHVWGYAATLGYMIPCTANDLRLAYTKFNSQRNDRVSTPGVILSSLSLPPTSSTVSIASSFPVGTTFSAGAGNIAISPTGVITVPLNIISATALSEFRLRSLNLDFSQYLNIDTQFRFRWFAGMQWTNVEHSFRAKYNLQGIETGDFIATLGEISVAVPTNVLSMGTEILNQKSEFKGIGPRFGTEGVLHIGGNIGLFGSMSTALLAGYIRNNLMDATEVMTTANFTVLTTPFTASSDSATKTSFQYDKQFRIVPNLNAKIGLDYTILFNDLCMRTATISVGYLWDIYFNATDSLAKTNAISPELRTRNTMDTSFNGIFISLAFRY